MAIKFLFCSKNYLARRQADFCKRTQSFILLEWLFSFSASLLSESSNFLAGSLIGCAAVFVSHADKTKKISFRATFWKSFQLKIFCTNMRWQMSELTSIKQRFREEWRMLIKKWTKKNKIRILTNSNHLKRTKKAIIVTLNISTGTFCSDFSSKRSLLNSNLWKKWRRQD